MADDRIVIEVQLDDGTIKKGFLNIEKQAEQTGKSVGNNLNGKGLSTLTKTLAGVTAAFLALRSAANLLGDAIRGASAEADAINRLNVALAQTGQFSKATSQSLIDFSNGLQATTKFANDSVLEVSALIQTLGRLDQEGLKRATTAALDLSVALGIDVNSAATLVGKAANGNIEAFRRYGVEIQKGKTDAETFANALRTLEERFGGVARSSAGTFSGALAQLSNVFGDVLDNIGFAITQSPSLIAVFNTISKVLVGFGERISQTIGNRDILKPILSSLVEISAVLVSVLGPAIEFISRSAFALFSSFVTGLKVVSTAIVGFGAILEKLGVSTFKGSSDALKGSLDSLSQSANSTSQAFGGLFNQSATQGSLDTLASLKGAIDQTNGSLNDLTQNLNNVKVAADLTPLQIGINDLKTNAAALGAQFNLVAQGIVQSAEALATQGSQSFRQLGDTALKGFGQAVGSAFAQFGAALAKGENGLKAFAKAFLASIGQTAVALGTEFILRGTAYLFVPGLQSLGGPLIAAGAALATFGGALAASSGGSASAGAGGGAVAGGGDFGAGTELPDTPASQERGPQIAVNIQGDVLDSQDTGLRIVDILREFADKNGDVVTA